MKTPINALFRSLAVFALAAASASAQFKPDFKLKPDDFTVLMGVDAELSDGLNRVSHSGHGKVQVSGWSRAEQSATWKVTAISAPTMIPSFSRLPAPGKPTPPGSSITGRR